MNELVYGHKFANQRHTTAVYKWIDGLLDISTGEYPTFTAAHKAVANRICDNYKIYDEKGRLVAAARGKRPPNLVDTPDTLDMYA